MTSIRLFTGSPAGPVTIVGKNRARLAEFALINQGWHTYGKDSATILAVVALAEMRLLDMDTRTRQFRWNDTRPAKA